MSQLIVSFNNQTIKRIKLVKPSYTIGRSSQCDIVLPDRTISNQHAKLINAGEDCFLEDSNSTNGIFINDHLSQKRLLMDNDAIRIGKYHLTFRSAVGLVTQLRQLSVHPQQAASPTHPWLEITNGHKKGNIIPLNRQQVTLGSQQTGKVTIERNQKGDYLLHTSNEDNIKEVRRLNENNHFSVGDVELIFRIAKEEATQT